MIQGSLLSLLIDLILVELLSTALVKVTSGNAVVNSVISLLKSFKLPPRDLYLLSIYDDQTERQNRLKKQSLEKVKKQKQNLAAKKQLAKGEQGGKQPAKKGRAKKKSGKVHPENE